jgi:DNA repair protein RecO (recombination protein O)
MPTFSTSAILLRRINYGDNDLIITFLTLNAGKVTVIAKHAKKSVKRFAGTLELFSELEMVCKSGKGKLPFLQEAVLTHPFPGIRADIKKTAYASYWAEIINEWVEKGPQQVPLYSLFHYALDALDQDRISAAALSILFQVRFLSLAGLSPNLFACHTCRTHMEKIDCATIQFDLPQGGLVCEGCCTLNAKKELHLSKGTIKQLLWINKGDLKQAERVKFTAPALREGLLFLETFVPYHLGKLPRSLKVLRQIRGENIC